MQAEEVMRQIMADSWQLRLWTLSA